MKTYTKKEIKIALWNYLDDLYDMEDRKKFQKFFNQEWKNFVSIHLNLADRIRMFIKREKVIE